MCDKKCDKPDYLEPEDEILQFVFGENNCQQNCNEEKGSNYGAALLFSILVAVIAVFLFSPWLHEYLSRGVPSSWSMVVKAVIFFIIVYILVIAFGSGSGNCLL